MIDEMGSNAGNTSFHELARSRLTLALLSRTRELDVPRRWMEREIREKRNPAEAGFSMPSYYLCGDAEVPPDSPLWRSVPGGVWVIGDFDVPWPFVVG
jgi:hypothetical protein